MWWLVMTCDGPLATKTLKILLPKYLIDLTWMQMTRNAADRASRGPSCQASWKNWTLSLLESAHPSPVRAEGSTVKHFQTFSSNFKQTANTNAWGIFGSTCCGMHSDLVIEVDLAYDALDCESFELPAKCAEVQALPAESLQPVRFHAVHAKLPTFVSEHSQPHRIWGVKSLILPGRLLTFTTAKETVVRPKKLCLRPHLFVQLRYAGWHHCDQVVGIRSLLQLTMLRTGSSRFSFLFSIRNWHLQEQSSLGGAGRSTCKPWKIKFLWEVLPKSCLQNKGRGRGTRGSSSRGRSERLRLEQNTRKPKYAKTRRSGNKTQKNKSHYSLFTGVKALQSLDDSSLCHFSKSCEDIQLDALLPWGVWHTYKNFQAVLCWECWGSVVHWSDVSTAAQILRRSHLAFHGFTVLYTERNAKYIEATTMNRSKHTAYSCQEGSIYMLLQNTKTY